MKLDKIWKILEVSKKYGRKYGIYGKYGKYGNYGVTGHPVATIAANCI